MKPAPTETRTTAMQERSTAPGRPAVAVVPPGKAVGGRPEGEAMTEPGECFNGDAKTILAALEKQGEAMRLQGLSHETRLNDISRQVAALPASLPCATQMGLINEVRDALKVRKENGEFLEVSSPLLGKLKGRPIVVIGVLVLVAVFGMLYCGVAASYEARATSKSIQRALSPEMLQKIQARVIVKGDGE